MSDWLNVTLLTALAGFAMPVGACLAAFENIQSRWLQQEFRHLVIAFGGGALLSAVALVLVPEGSEHLSIPAAAVCFASGGLSFMALDIWLARVNSPMGQMAAMLSDFVPESIALGAAIAAGSQAGLLLAGLVALQNVPEGFNAFRELRTAFRPATIITAFSAMALLGPVSGLTGFYLLAPYPVSVAGIMMFAAGGILYIVFGDIAPEAKLKNAWMVPFGAVAGFLLGLIGKMLTG